MTQSGSTAPRAGDTPAGAIRGLPRPLSAVVMAALLVVRVVAAFGPCLGNGFVSWDDEGNFPSNPGYRGLGWSQLWWDWTSFHLGVYQPLARMILGCEWLLWGLRPWGYHLTSLLLYAADTVVLFFLTVSLVHRCDPERADREPGVLLASAWIAVAFHSVHPLRRLGGGPGRWIGPRVRAVWWEKLPFVALSHGAGRSYAAHANRGWALFEQGRLGEAREELAAALRINPCHADARNNLGLVLKAQGRHAEALNAFDEALRLNPGSAEARQKLEQVREALSRQDAARAQLGEAQP